MNTMNRKTELSSAQLSKLQGLIKSFDRIADQKIGWKISRPSRTRSGNEKKANLLPAENSLRTRKASREVMHGIFALLFDLGFQLENVGNIKRRHVEKLVLHWYAIGLKAKTMNGYLTEVRKCGLWSGKDQLIPHLNALQFFLPHVDRAELKVSTIARQSKSWSEQGIDVIAKILEADRIDIRFGAMLRLALAFGFRRKEQLRCVPTKMDGGGVVMVRGNISKNGRDRNIEILDPFQRQCLDHAKKIAGKGGKLGWPGLTYEQSVNRYNYLMGKKLGITGADADCVGHGLRAEFSENLALRLGFIPPTLGGAADQLPAERIAAIQRRVSDAMGHARPEITGAYYGSVRLKPTELGRRFCSLVIGDGLVAGLYVNPLPVKNDEGHYPCFSLAQRERMAVHLQLERDASEKPEGVWRIKGFGDLQAIDVLAPHERQALSEKVQVVLEKLGWAQ